MFEDRFADIVGFGTPGAPGQLLEAFFDRQRKSNCQHGTSLYKYSTQMGLCFLWPQSSSEGVNLGVLEWPWERSDGTLASQQNNTMGTSDPKTAHKANGP